MKIIIHIACKYLLARRRQSLVSISGIALGVSFFLAIAALMQGSEKDFITRLIDNSPHITIKDEFRNPRIQPVHELYPEAAVEVRSVKPVDEARGIRNYEKILAGLRAEAGIVASPSLTGQALITFGGREYGVTVNGMIPEEINDVTTIEKYMQVGSTADLIANPDGVILGEELARIMSITVGDNLTVASVQGVVRTFKVLGLFRTGRANFDQREIFTTLSRVQILLNRPDRINSILIKLDDPYKAQQLAAITEARIAYKNISWQESSKDIMNALIVRNIIMYTVVSAVLLVAAFGIYNVISTVVLEKQRDIAILKSIGFFAFDIQYIFILQGVLLGVAGCLIGLPLGCCLMLLLMQIRFTPPGSIEEVQMPIDWSWPQFVIGVLFAIFSAVIAAYLPARKASRVQPVDILRGIQ